MESLNEPEGQIASLFLEASCAMLDQMTQQLAACMAKLNDDQIWQRSGAHENAIGNLILHLCGNMRQWIMHGVGQQPDIRTREVEFSTTGALPGAALLATFQSTVSEAKVVIGSTAAERLCELTHPQGREVTVLYAIYQVVGHVRQHVGQVILLTKQMTEQDLDLSIPRPR
jgi:uncharacterized damage-inducible protein DinB